MKRILLTGGTGFVGSHICKKLLEEGYYPVLVHRPQSGFTRDIELSTSVEKHAIELEDRGGMSDIMRTCDAVVHCAALLSMNAADKFKLYKTNVELTRHLVDLALETGVRRFVHISSVAALAYHPGGKILDESDGPGNDTWYGHYGKSKYLAELEVRRAEAEGLEVVILNPSFILGPGNWQKSTPSLFARLYEKILFYPEGSQGFVDVRDVADAAVKCLVYDVAGERFIISAENLSWEKIIAMIRNAYGKDVPGRPIPVWFRKAAGTMGDLISRFTGSPVGFNSGLLDSLSHRRGFDNSKSRQLLNMNYREIADTVKEVSHLYLKSRDL